MSIEDRTALLVCRLVARYYLKRPEMAGFLHSKYFSYSGLLAAIRNELAFKRGSLTVPEVRLVAMELTNRCNLACTVCPVNNGMKRPKGFMDFDTYCRVLEGNSGIEILQLCLWGESLLHPRLLDFIQFASRRGVRTYLYTNGTLLDDKMSVQILESDLNRILFSLDGFSDTYTRIRGCDYRGVEEKIFRFLHLREKMRKEIRVGVAMVACDETTGLIQRFRERWEGVVDEVQITPHIIHQEYRRNSRCRLLWLGYPIVLWDGRVVPCCVDYEGTLAFGNVDDEPDLREIWNGKRAVEMRREHLAGRFRRVCGRCHEFRSAEVHPRFDE